MDFTTLLSEKGTNSEVIGNASDDQSELPAVWQAPLRSDQKEWASTLGEAVATAAVTLGVAPEVLFRVRMLSA